MEKKDSEKDDDETIHNESFEDKNNPESDSKEFLGDKEPVENFLPDIVNDQNDFIYEGKKENKVEINNGENMDEEQDEMENNKETKELQTIRYKKEKKRDSRNIYFLLDAENDDKDLKPIKKLREEDNQNTNRKQSYNRKQSNEESGFIGEQERYIRRMDHPRKEQMRGSFPPHENNGFKRKSLLEHLFDVIDNEARLLHMHPNQRRRSSLDYLFDAANVESQSFNRNRYRKFPLNEHETGSPVYKIKRSRGRPPLLSPELLSSDYDDNGVKIDSTGKGIDFDDSLFETVSIDQRKEFLCPEKECGKQFPSLSRAKRHYIVHTGHKPYKCLNPECKKSFSRKDNMLQHYRSHCSLGKPKYT